MALKVITELLFLATLLPERTDVQHRRSRTDNNSSRKTSIRLLGHASDGYTRFADLIDEKLHLLIDRPYSTIDTVPKTHIISITDSLIIETDHPCIHNLYTSGSLCRSQPVRLAIMFQTRQDLGFADKANQMIVRSQRLTISMI